MELLAYEGKQKSKEKPIYIRVMENRCGVEIIACDENGETLGGGYLLTITPKGIKRESSVAASFGFPLDKMGHIKIEGYD